MPSISGASRCVRPTKCHRRLGVGALDEHLDLAPDQRVARRTGDGLLHCLALA